MKLDSGTIWSEASALVSANKEVLAAVAGVFFLLPSLAFSLLMPAPEPQAGASREAMMAMVRDFYMGAAPWLLLMVLVQALGQLAAFALLARSGRITVGEALREGAAALLPYFATQLLITLAMGLVVAVLIGIAAASGSIGVMVLIGLVAAVAVAWISLRLAMILPVIAVDRVRNPVAVIRRSWDLTRGNVGALLLYLTLLLIAFVIGAVVIGMVTGLIATVLGGAKVAEIVGAAVSALLGAGFTVYIVASLAVIHRRLSSGSRDEHAETFG